MKRRDLLKRAALGAVALPISRDAVAGLTDQGQGQGAAEANQLTIGSYREPWIPKGLTS